MPWMHERFLEQYLAYVRKLEAIAEAVKKISGHTELCKVAYGDYICDCGYDALQKALKELET